ncbi:hypothetical protein HN51_047249, partial [Arachis hypogaea]
PTSCLRLSVSALSSLASATDSLSLSPRHSLELGTGIPSPSPRLSPRRQFVTLSLWVSHRVTLSFSHCESVTLRLLRRVVVVVVFSTRTGTCHTILPELRRVWLPHMTLKGRGLCSWKC